MQFIDAAETARRLPYPALIAALARGLQQPIVSPARSHFQPNSDASAVLVMSAWQPGGLFGCKIVSIWPGNNAIGKPAVSAAYVAMSCEDGSVLALIDGTELTLRRTAAAAALAAHKLARPASQRLVVLGCGALALPMVEAHRAVFALSDVVIWGRQLAKAQAVVDTLARAGIAARAESDLQRALAEADIAVAVTTATQAFIPPAWVRPGTHLGLVGAFTLEMAEAEPALLVGARLFADNREAVLQKGGEVLQALQRGLILESDIRAELAELVDAARPAAGRLTDSDVTVFKSVGFAALDLIAADLVLQRARDGSDKS